MDDYGQDYGYSDTTEEIPSWMGGNVDPATLQWYSGLNENNSGNAESMAGWTYKDGVWTDSKGQTYDTKTGTGSLVFAASPVLTTPDLGTPSALVGTNITGTATSLTAGNATSYMDNNSTAAYLGWSAEL
jgi:hypothetical protein